MHRRKTLDSMTAKRIVHIILCAAAVSLTAVAQNPAKGVSFDVAVGAGYSTLEYKAQDVDALKPRAVGDWGMNAHIGINWFFVDYLGIGVGVDATRYGGGLNLTGQMDWADVTDTDGERYNHTLTIDRWRETQQEWYIAPQFLIHAAIPAGQARVLISLGAEYAFCLSSAYRGTGTLTHTGYYPYGNLTLHDVPKHGFYTTDMLRPNGKGDADIQQLSLLGKVGVAIPVARHWNFTCNLIAKYAVYSSRTRTAGGDASVGFYENQTTVGNAAEDPHGFIPPYAPLTTTALTTGKYAPLYVGLEIGVRYTIPQKKKLCLCLDY